MKKKNVFISGFDLNTNNRGTQALSYGSLTFLNEKEKLNNDVEIISPGFYINPFKNWKTRIKRENIVINGTSWNIKTRKYWIFDIKMTLLFQILLKINCPLTPLGKDIKNMEYMAAICGGDGFSDIYAEKTMFGHIRWVIIANKMRKKYLFLPQTIGPFHKEKNLKKALALLVKADKVFIRDNVFEEKLTQNNIEYEICEDLSFFMKPQPFKITLLKNAIGINISGLCYFNSFYNLSGKFKNYKQLMIELVKSFQSNSIPIYIIPHSYNYTVPEENADDLKASIEFYNELNDKRNITLINSNLKSPEIKFLISQMSFFIGSRLHSCFAAIFTKTPVHGLAYSDKYEGTFKKYGLNNSYSKITNIEINDINIIINKIHTLYHSVRK